MKKLSLPGLIVALVSGTAVAVLVSAIVIFTSLYTGALRSNATASSEQSVIQAADVISDYTADTSQLIRRIVSELDGAQSAQEISSAFATMVEMRDDLTSISVYSQGGVLLSCWADNRRRKSQVGTLDLAQLEPDTAGLYFVPPHVQNLYADYYPWVITVARQVETNRYGGPVFVAVDLQFSTIAAYMDNVGIGQRGYSFIVDGDGNLIYHPQQQMIYAGLKSEDTTPFAAMADGVHAAGNTIYVTRALSQGDWRIVGVSYLDELVDEPRRAALGRLSMIFPVVVVLLIGVSSLCARQVSRPIDRLAQQMRLFEEDAAGFTYTAISGTREIGVLSESFEHMVVRIQRLMDEAKKEEETLRKIELKALQAQINPHFLYNTLDSIQWMCEVGRTKEAVEMVSALARLFRISTSRGAELIPLDRELEHAASYLIIQKFRYKDQFEYRFAIDEQVRDCLCSKITLQPIIENAILHGFGEFVDDGEIVISATVAGDDVLLTVTDNGIGMDEQTCRAILSDDRSDASGIGIKNVNDRIRIFFGAPYGLTIDSEPDHGTHVTIRLPQIREEHP